MTRDEVISHGVTPEIAKAITTFIKTNLPMNPRIADPTSIINNEGVITGWMKAADLVSSLSNPLNPVIQPEPMYSQPAPR